MQTKQTSCYLAGCREPSRSIDLWVGVLTCPSDNGSLASKSKSGGPEASNENHESHVIKLAVIWVTCFKPSIYEQKAVLWVKNLSSIPVLLWLGMRIEGFQLENTNLDQFRRRHYTIVWHKVQVPSYVKDCWILGKDEWSETWINTTTGSDGYWRKECLVQTPFLAACHVIFDLPDGHSYCLDVSLNLA
jgi:hypothetical protein